MGTTKVKIEKLGETGWRRKIHTGGKSRAEQKPGTGRDTGTVPFEKLEANQCNQESQGEGRAL